MKKINIAIDGFSSCGKGTLAKALSIHLNYIFVDSGAMYRAVTLAVIKNNIDYNNLEAIKNLLKNINISFEYSEDDGFYYTCLNGKQIENEIRTMAVNQLVSQISKIDEVRTFLVKQQQNIGQNKGVVMDGRDIGTVVFPDAEIKFFLTAEPKIRAQRRFDEMRSKGNTEVTFEEVLDNLKSRDRIDSSRENSPLKKSDDAIEINNSYLNKEEQFQLALKYIFEQINS